MEYKRQYRDLPDEVKQKISASMKGRAKSYNEVLNLFRSVSVDYEADKTKNQDKSCDLSCLVAEAGLEPTTSGL